ncbi:hypothetical protein P153DRAFT_358432 [Dothidotthia symphoricarpi CBS 119687]|uniref:Uncharacterized protein n=1 Tax=Dothidotthia symphoricarpi CBS 119687 TaxID=1392245 RepID=A0A6A6A9P0_9PLEO|nr:uncharacterized protein P153DRAFT_358432 [Dothidotthia symphoricarpi CBS 119687]KAF2127557.1 hypothetical protein P153DRAFT_358432 [Dothidotthia symphoricarpi CBS 119687]
MNRPAKLLPAPTLPIHIRSRSRHEAHKALHESTGVSSPLFLSNLNAVDEEVRPAPLQAPTLPIKSRSSLAPVPDENDMSDSEMSDIRTSDMVGVNDVDDPSQNFLDGQHETSNSVLLRDDNMEVYDSGSSSNGSEPSALEDVQKGFKSFKRQNSVEKYTHADVTERIQYCIEYSRACLQKGDLPAITSNFYVPITDPPSEVCQSLRSAAEEGVARLVWSAPSEECYTLGVQPLPVPTGYPYAVIAEPQWWVNQEDAQIRAGPDAEVGEVSRAQSYLREKAKRQAKSLKKSNSHVNQALRKLEEGLRRQEQGLPMHD